MKKYFLFLICSTFAFLQIHASDLTDTINTFQADQRALYNTYTMVESQEFYERFSTFYDDWKQRVEVIDFDALDADGKVDFILLKNLVNKEDYELQLEYENFKEVADVTAFPLNGREDAEALYTFIQERRRGKRPDAEALAKTFTEAGKSIDNKMIQLKGKPFKDWMQADKASKIITSLQEGLKEAYEFYFDYDPQFTWWMKEPYKGLDTKLTEYTEFLSKNYSEKSVKDDGSGIVGKPIGREAVIKALEFEMIPYSPEELIAAAKKQFKWCKAEMIKASEEMGYGKDWHAALEHVKNTYVPPGEQPDTINGLLDYSVKFIEDRDLITLPDLAKETWGMIMMTPERQKINPFFTGGWEISISYPTEGMAQEDKMMSMRGNNPNFSFPTVQHELLPGHNLEFYMTARHKPYRRAFDTPFWMEGWALYWEITLWNKGFPQTPEQKMGMLFWRIHRCARIIFSLNYQLGNMTAQESIDLLVNEVGHERANAEAEVRRSFTGGTPPLYQIAYMIGGLQFYALKKELMDKDWTEKQFHDRVLHENMMPVEVLRLLLEEKDFSKDYKTQWKFSMDFE